MLCSVKRFVCSAVLVLATASGIAPFAPSSDAAAAQQIGVAEKVVGDVYGNDILRRLKANEDIYRDERITSGARAAADFRFRDQSRLMVGPNSEIVLDKFVYDPDTSISQGIINLARGVLRFTSAAADNGLSFKTPSAEIGIRGTAIDVMVAGDTTEIVVHEGRVQVTGAHGSIFVNAGKTLILTNSGPQLRTSRSPEIQQAVGQMLALVDNRTRNGNTIQTATQLEQTPASAPAASGAQQHSRTQRTGPVKRPAAASNDEIALQTTAIRGKDPQNLLYLDLPYGRVIIEMRSDLAPHHVARIKQLVRDKFYDGLAFHSVAPGRFAMTGDPTGTGRGGSGQTLDGEFSREPFRRGSVGMAHDHGKPNSADSQFFVSLEAFPEIDGKYTLWGQVIHGMHFIDQLRTGNPPARPDTILRMSVAADVTG